MNCQSRRGVLCLFASIVCVLLVAGCGGSSSPAAEGADSGAQVAAQSIFETEVPIPDGQQPYDITDTPPHWPSFIGVPATLDPSTGFFMDQPTPQGRSLAGTFFHDEDDSFGIDALEALVAMGFEPTLDNERDGGRFTILRRGNEEVQLTLGPGSSKISISG